MILDFLIFYEHKTRELENAVLLASALRIRGYSVEITHVFSAKMLYKKVKVLIVPAAYNSKDIFNYTHFFRCKIYKIINLQYEQVLSEKQEQIGAQNPKELAVKIQHIVWGERTKHRLMCAGIHESNLHVVGHIATDLDFPRFSSIFLERREIAQKYGLPMEKNWHIFLSSFTLCNMSEALKIELTRKTGDLTEKIWITDYSQEKILQWFENIIRKNADIYIIYRAHPAECISNKVLDLEKKYVNFRCISDLSVRQWIHVVDSISTWFSTSIIDTYYANKNCAVLRPIDIPEEMDAIVFKDGKYIKSESEFEKYIYNVNSSFPLKEKYIKEFYGEWKDGKCYERLCDVCEKVLNSNDFIYDFYPELKVTLKDRIKSRGRQICTSISAIINISRLMPPRYRDYFMYAYRDQKGCKKLLKEYEKSFNMILKKGN